MELSYWARTLLGIGEGLVISLEEDINEPATSSVLMSIYNLFNQKGIEFIIEADLNLEREVKLILKDPTKLKKTYLFQWIPMEKKIYDGPAILGPNSHIVKISKYDRENTLRWVFVCIWNRNGLYGIQVDPKINLDEELSLWTKELLDMSTQFQIDLGNCKEGEMDKFISDLDVHFKSLGIVMWVLRKGIVEVWVKIDRIVEPYKWYETLPNYIPNKTKKRNPDKPVRFTRWSEMSTHHESFVTRWNMKDGLRKFSELDDSKYNPVISYTVDESLSTWSKSLLGLITEFRVTYIKEHAKQFGCTHQDILNSLVKVFEKKGTKIFFGEPYDLTVVDISFHMFMEGDYDLEKISKAIRSIKDKKLLGVSLYEREGFHIHVSKPNGPQAAVYYFNKHDGIFKKGF